MKMTITDDAGNPLFSLLGRDDDPTYTAALFYYGFDEFMKKHIPRSSEKREETAGGTDYYDVLKLFVGQGGRGVDTVHVGPNDDRIRSTFSHLLGQGYIYLTFGNTYSLTLKGIRAVLPLLKEWEPRLSVKEVVSMDALFFEEEDEKAQRLLKARLQLGSLFGQTRYGKLSDGSSALIFDTPDVRAALPDTPALKTTEGGV